MLVTHEHIDHIRGVGVLSRRYDLPVYATEGTWTAMEDKLGGVALKNARVLEPLRDLVRRRHERHGLRHPPRRGAARGLRHQRLGGARLSVATDIGCVRESWLNVAAGSDAVVLESNYDPDMLRAGPYPYALKQRILGSRGHLANDDAGRAAAGAGEGAGRGRSCSATSARRTTSQRWRRRAARWRWRTSGVRLGDDASLCVAERDGLTGIFSVRMGF